VRAGTEEVEIIEVRTVEVQKLLDQPAISPLLRQQFKAELQGLRRQLPGALQRLNQCEQAAAGGPARKAAKVTKVAAKKAVAKKKKKVLTKKKKSTKKKR
jgi:hypothetical protein